jgi:pimeloyl-ACP methyl ester carboxylesterase
MTGLFVLGLVLLLWVVAGRQIMKLLLGRPPKTDPRRQDAGDLAPTSTQRLTRPDGSELKVEFYGPEDGQPIVLTHAWSLDSREWRYLKRELSNQFRLIAWDIPGCGESKRPDNGDYRLENLANHLQAVLELAQGRPAVLLGHSIGGMTTLTFCRLFPKALGTTVKGLILVHTTYTNPLRTIILSRLLTALERPLIKPLCHLTIWLSPLLYVTNWLNYYNGTTHLMTRLAGFSRNCTWEQIELTTRPQALPTPAIHARGTLGMLAYDATQTLSKIRVPTLIIAGDMDPLCKPEASEYMHHHIQGAKLAVLAPARHLGIVEYPARGAELIREFVTTRVQGQKQTVQGPKKKR